MKQLFEQPFEVIEILGVKCLYVDDQDYLVDGEKYKFSSPFDHTIFAFCYPIKNDIFNSLAIVNHNISMCRCGTIICNAALAEYFGNTDFFKGDTKFNDSVKLTDENKPKFLGYKMTIGQYKGEHSHQYIAFYHDDTVDENVFTYVDAPFAEDAKYEAAKIFKKNGVKVSPETAITNENISVYRHVVRQSSH